MSVVVLNRHREAALPMVTVLTVAIGTPNETSLTDAIGTDPTSAPTTQQLYPTQVQ